MSPAGAIGSRFCTFSRLGTEGRSVEQSHALCPRRPGGYWQSIFLVLHMY